MAVRDHLHDPLNVDLDGGSDLGACGASPAAGRIDHPPSFFLARRCRTATCFMNNRIGTAGTAADRLPRRDIAHQPGFGGNARAAADRQVAGEPGLPSHHDKIAEPGAARDADLAGQDAAAAEHDIVPDLHQIIDHRARADDRVMPRAAVDRRIGADIDIVADHDPPELRDLDRAARDRAQSQIRPGRCARRGAARRGRRSGNGSASRWRRCGNRRPARPRPRSPYSGRSGSARRAERRPR